MPVRIRPSRQMNHYETLKVSEKAPLEVIKAAYRVLSMRWHPDKNPGDTRAVQMMRLLNEAYEVLSDPVRRTEYDDTLARSSKSSDTTRRDPSPPPAWKPRKTRSFSFAMVVREIRRWDFRWLLAGGAVVLAACSLFLAGSAAHRYFTKRAEAATASTATDSSTETTAGSSETPPAPAIDLRFTNPLNGHAWPKKAAYLAGFEKLATDGYSSVTVDNSKNTSDVFLKLVSAEYREPSKVMRVCFIPARSTFTFYRVTPGRYELRYQEVEDGNCRKTETFVLSQKQRLQGVECTQLRVPLYGLPNHSVTLLQSDEHEFLAAVPTASH